MLGNLAAGLSPSTLHTRSVHLSVTGLSVPTGESTQAGCLCPPVSASVSDSCTEHMSTRGLLFPGLAGPRLCVSPSPEWGPARPEASQGPLGKGKGKEGELTLPRSKMKQSPLLKLSQDTGTSVARTTRRPLTWKSLCTTTSLGATCLNPDATPPFC